MAETTQGVEEKTKEQAVQDDSAQNDAKKQAQSVELSEVAGAEATGSGTSIDILLDMNVPVTVAVGQTEISIQLLLQLGPGSVLKLDKPIDAPADLYLKDMKFATGSIVVIDEQFAVRIKQILNAPSVANPTGA